MKLEDVLPLLRRHAWWLAPLVVLLVNVGVLSTYRSLYSGRVDVLGEAIAEETAQLEKIASQQAQVAALVERADAAEKGIASLYEDRFATESERLTAVIREVRELASRAGVVPDRISYPEEVFEDFGLIKRSLEFTVDGSYQELRLFVNYLEQSESFLVLESLGLQDGDTELRIRTTLSTLFSGRDVASDRVGG